MRRAMSAHLKLVQVKFVGCLVRLVRLVRAALHGTAAFHLECLLIASKYIG